MGNNNIKGPTENVTEQIQKVIDELKLVVPKNVRFEPIFNKGILVFSVNQQGEAIALTFVPVN